MAIRSARFNGAMKAGRNLLHPEPGVSQPGPVTRWPDSSLRYEPPGRIVASRDPRVPRSRGAGLGCRVRRHGRRGSKLAPAETSSIGQRSEPDTAVMGRPRQRTDHSDAGLAPPREGSSRAVPRALAARLAVPLARFEDHLRAAGIGDVDLPTGLHADHADVVARTVDLPSRCLEVVEPIPAREVVDHVVAAA